MAYAEEILPNSSLVSNLTTIKERTIAENFEIKVDPTIKRPSLFLNADKKDLMFFILIF